MDILDFFWTFYLNHLSPLWGYFIMTYCFVHQMSYKDTMRETAITCNDFGEYIETSRETVCDYKRYCRDVCFNIVK